MAIFYFIFVSIDWMLIAIGNTLEDEKDLFMCFEDVYLIVIKNKGAWFFICQSLFLFLFSILIWHIFYRLPDSYGLLKKREAKSMRVSKMLKGMENINP